MKTQEFKELVYQEFALIAGAFAHPKRVEMIEILAQGERNVEGLARSVSLTVANTSRHLQLLKNARLVKSRKVGVTVYYSLADEQVVGCLKSLQALAERRSAEIREVMHLFFKERDSLEPLSIDELRRRIEQEDVVLLDVRPKSEYATAHIRGALNMPLDELKHKLHQLARDRDIVAYCRGPYCVMSAEAVKLLREAGFRAFRLEQGVYEWKAAGLPVEEGA